MEVEGDGCALDASPDDDDVASSFVVVGVRGVHFGGWEWTGKVVAAAVSDERDGR